MPVHLKVLRGLAAIQGTTYATKEEADTDCSYCRAPCCQLLVVLKKEELEKYEHEWRELDGKLKPLLKRRESDGYCVYFVHGHGCSTYEDKPYVCDFYSCRDDKRITPSLKYGKVKKLE